MLKNPDDLRLSEEEIINFLENYLFHNKISLIPPKDIEEFDKMIEKASYKQLKEAIESFLERLGINKDTITPIFPYLELESELGIRGQMINYALKQDKQSLANDLYIDTEFGEATRKFMIKYMKEKLEANKNERKSKK